MHDSIYGLIIGINCGILFMLLRPINSFTRFMYVLNLLSIGLCMVILPDIWWVYVINAICLAIILYDINTRNKE